MAIIHSYSLNIEPKEHFINWQQDSFENYLARVVMHDKVKEFKVEVEVVAEMTVINPFYFFLLRSMPENSHLNMIFRILKNWHPISKLLKTDRFCWTG